MAKLYNLAAMTVASTGTGTITLGVAATINGVLYLSFAAAGVSNGETVAYSINDVGGSEVGTGVYTSSGTTLTRSPVTSTNGNAAINMTAAAIVRISPAKEDIANLRESNTFTSTSGQIINGLVDISAATAGQIKFPATQNASANANTLDDYEEGTWTPAITFGGGNTGITYSTQSGQYTKVGNLVRAGCVIQLSNKGSSTGNVLVTGLPFAHVAFLTAFVPYIDGVTSGVGDTMITARLSGSATSVELYKMSAGTATSLTNADLTNTSFIIVNGQYQTA